MLVDLRVIRGLVASQMTFEHKATRQNDCGAANEQRSAVPFPVTAWTLAAHGV